MLITDLLRKSNGHTERERERERERGVGGGFNNKYFWLTTQNIVLKFGIRTITVQRGTHVIHHKAVCYLSCCYTV